MEKGEKRIQTRDFRLAFLLQWFSVIQMMTSKDIYYALSPYFILLFWIAIDIFEGNGKDEWRERKKRRMYFF